MIGPHKYQVQIGRDTGHSRGAYYTRYTFAHEYDAVFYFRGINVGRGYKKRLVLDGRTIARVFSA